MKTGSVQNQQPLKLSYQSLLVMESLIIHVLNSQETLSDAMKVSKTACTKREKQKKIVEKAKNLVELKKGKN